MRGYDLAWRLFCPVLMRPNRRVQGSSPSAPASKINVWTRTEGFSEAGSLRDNIRDNIGGISVSAMIRLTERQLAAAARPRPKSFEVAVGPTPAFRLRGPPPRPVGWCF